MRIDIISAFPQFFDSVSKTSILKRAIGKNLVKINLVNLRDFAKDKRKTIDDRPYGGGVGMILRADIIARAIQFRCNLEEKPRGQKAFTILLDPKGKLFNQQKAQKLASKSWLILICGHYEGVDARVTNFVDEVISVGDYILTGGEPAAVIVVDAVTRLIPGVVGKKQSLSSESFKQHLLEYPQYTKPEQVEKFKVPKILLTGDSKKIAQWRQRLAVKLTKQARADLFTKFKEEQRGQLDRSEPHQVQEQVKE